MHRKAYRPVQNIAYFVEKPKYQNVNLPSVNYATEIVAVGLYQNVKKDLWNLMQMIEGLEAVIIADRDGVPIIKVSSEVVPDASTRTLSLPLLPLQLVASKLGLSKKKAYLFFPLLSGLLLGLEPELENLVALVGHTIQTE
ncbi:putative ragulator complex protein LAMTOR3 [Apostichopus japonicus]|uniref:Putative ragulator complex protein LAMTOR3 n=1 Tax=Stichopus japonicus TaxID=307972 RepID=A0A2G8L4J3_STIJA|nr:putative ragulator complex protein LAMTOR3 [Apostichopus japonicus]